MTPVLVDTRGWIKFSFLTLSCTAIIFYAGFFFGYQEATSTLKAVEQAVASSVSETAVLEIETAEVNSDESLSHENLGELGMGELDNMNVNHSELESSGDSIVIYETNSIEMLVAETEEMALTEQLKNTSVEISADTFVAEESDKTSETAVVQNIASQTITPQTIGAHTIENHVSDKTLNPTLGIGYSIDNMDEIKYSIQADVYVKLLSAEKIAKKYSAEKYDAYVLEYINPKNKIRYSVRLGYFVDKRSALPTLYRFRKERNSEAYLVKFSPDTIVYSGNDAAIVGLERADSLENNVDMLVNINQ